MHAYKLEETWSLSELSPHWASSSSGSVNLGSPIGVLIKRKRISLDNLNSKIVAIDAFNALYQFLAIIRLRDGTPLRDLEGRVTSHLSGLFYRTVNLLEHEIRPVYVFDGRPPNLKRETLARREAIKKKFTREWMEALERGDLQVAFKKSVMTSRLDARMIVQAHELLGLLGVPWIQAPSEGEAQAAHMAGKGNCYAAASQDYDSLLFNSPRLIINLTIAGKRYYPKRGLAVNLIPELAILEETLSSLRITLDQLIDVAILVGTDFNGGIYGVGPKRALALVRRFGNIERIMKNTEIRADSNFETIREFYQNPPVIDVENLTWSEPDYEGLREFLRHADFDEARVDRALSRLKSAGRSLRQSGLEGWV